MKELDHKLDNLFDELKNMEILLKCQTMKSSRETEKINVLSFTEILNKSKKIIHKILKQKLQYIFQVFI